MTNRQGLVFVCMVGQCLIHKQVARNTCKSSQHLGIGDPSLAQPFNQAIALALEPMPWGLLRVGLHHSCVNQSLSKSKLS